jgi:hypothetical protein
MDRPAQTNTRFPLTQANALAEDPGIREGKYPPIQRTVLAEDPGNEFPFKGYDSELTIPQGNNANQNASLTIHLYVTLEYLDNQNRLEPFIVQHEGKPYAKDSNGNLFPVLDWDDASRAAFERGFMERQKHWDGQFLLVTPPDYDRLDYTTSDYLVRPNVLCLFRLHLNEPRSNTTVCVVRLDHSFSAHRFLHIISWLSSFRSNSGFYPDSAVDPADRTAGHELGHVIGQSHILGLQGQYQDGVKNSAKCQLGKFTANEDECYEDSDGDGSNIMGRGTDLISFNAISWQKRIAVHCPGTSWLDWEATMSTTTAPRKLVLSRLLR